MAVPPRSPPRLTDWVLAAALAGTGGLLALAGGLWLFRDVLLLAPPPRSYDPGPRVVRLALPTGGDLAAVHLRGPAGAPLVVCFGDADEDLGLAGERRLGALAATGAAVLAFDYPGYGLSDGPPSLEASLAAGRAALRHAREDLRVPPTRTFLHGAGLGAALALRLAATEPVAGLILEYAAPGELATRVGLPWVPGEPLDNAAGLRALDRPVLLLHGAENPGRPLGDARGLLRAAGGPATFLWVQGGLPANLADAAGPAYGATVAAFLRRHGAVANP